MRRLLSVVVSVYNEEEALAQFYQVTEGILNTISWDYDWCLLRWEQGPEPSHFKPFSG